MLDFLAQSIDIRIMNKGLINKIYMGHVICIGSQKGGVGKTTTALNLGVAFAISEKKVLIIDSDPQGHATLGLGIDRSKIRHNLYHGLKEKMLYKDLIFESNIDSLEAIPSGYELIQIEMEMAAKAGKEWMLNDLLNGIREEYDFIIIDCSPSFNLLTLNAIIASDSFLIPLQCEYYAFEGLGQLLKTYKILKKRFDVGIEIEGILLTMYSPNEKISREIANSLRNNFKKMIFKVTIPRDTRLKESACYSKPLAFREIKSVGARCYLDLANEILLKRKVRN